MRDTSHEAVRTVPVSREMNLVTHLEMNKLFALSASVIRLLSTADRIITPKGTSMCKSHGMLFGA